MNETHRDDWNTHWDEYSDAAWENPAQEYRRKVIADLLGIEGAGQGACVVDIGSGQGDMARDIRRELPLAEILGLELSRSGVEISRKKVHDATFAERNLLEQEEIPLELRHWGTHAVCSEVIEHVDDPARLLRNARRYLQPFAVLVVTAPGGPMSAFDKHIGHRRHFRPETIRELLENAGYDVERVDQAGFPFFNLYRCVVILRGQKLVDDVSSERNPSGSWLAKTFMRVFHLLFHMNLRSSPWGWQMVAKARPLGVDPDD